MMIERLAGAKDKYAGTVANELIKDFQLSTSYPPEERDVIPPEDLTEIVSSLSSKIASEREKANQKTTKKEIVMTTNKALVQEESHPLQHLIPSKEKWSNNGAYISREIGGIKDLDALKSALESKNNVLVYGPTGSAKSARATR